MFKKILVTSLIVLQISTQSACAFEFQPVLFIQSLPISPDILKNKTPARIESAFLFFKISDSFVSHALVDDQGIRISSEDLANEMLSNPAGWRLTGAYLRTLSLAPIGARGHQLRKSLVEQSASAANPPKNFQ